MLTQGLLSFKYEEEKTPSGMTSLAGLPLYMEMAHALNLRKAIDHKVKIRSNGQGWTDSENIISLILLNLSAGESVSDIENMESDTGFKRFFSRFFTYGMKRKEKKAYKKRFRIEKKRVFPSSSAMFDYLEHFHNEKEEKKRRAGKSFIPESNEYLKGLIGVNHQVVRKINDHSPKETATLDMDAVLVETQKEDALYCYKKFKAYQPLNTYWAEHDLILHSEFRDGNVPAGSEQLRVFKESLSVLPSSVKKVYHRSDSAGYQRELLKYCAEGRNERFGVIEFAVSADVTVEFKDAVFKVEEEGWHPIHRTAKDGTKRDTGQQWAEVCYVPNWISHSKNNPDYRFIAIREPMKQRELPGFEKPAEQLPFPTMEFGDNGRYKVFGVVTNRDIPGEELIWWLRKRCGKSEEKHSEMKAGFAGGRMPSGKFGANAAWWQIMIIALNLNTALKRLALPQMWRNRQMKAIRFHIINLPGRVIPRSRQFFVRLAEGHPSNGVLINARRNILALAHGPPG